MSNITLFVVIIYTAVLLEASSECKKKAVKKKIKQYQGKCLKRAFQSSIGCKKKKRKIEQEGREEMSQN